jgi:hypothetical protein
MKRLISEILRLAFFHPSRLAAHLAVGREVIE